ncbi:hypothetical protein SAMN00017405_1121 [Desulfonispora thiosulfatigenes DSM 11270]|uniref:Uncharacterized protein n=1 Tax=Desulfonispora thiosulfatigenes DSM 11270 TaxID=656914 RepID=A0A1W1UYD9_DESTI|nr:hypothetical protein [Desulfonispora thiosulfatigenes]SMB86113.1 hypothetical protein SAMN00017405_1121 [Desulfonispora thiosulfatigenes DSM 11270]
MKKRWFQVLLVIVSIWLVITIYFYNQHKISINRCVIDKHIAYENTIIKIDELVVTDHEKNYVMFDSWHFKVVPRLPGFLQKPFLLTSSFYRKPYKELEYNEDHKFGIMSLKATIFEKNLDPEYLHNINEKIHLMDDQGNYLPTTENGTDNEDYISFFYKKNKRFDKSIENINIVLKDDKDNIVTTIPVNLKWQIENYNYFNRMPNWNFYLDPRNTVRELIIRKKSDEDYLDLFQEQGQKIDSENLNHDYWQDTIHSESINYIGNYKEWENVYLSELEFKKDNVLESKQKTYLIDTGKTFKIIEISPLQVVYE